MTEQEQIAELRKMLREYQEPAVGCVSLAIGHLQAGRPFQAMKVLMEHEYGYEVTRSDPATACMAELRAYGERAQRVMGHSHMLAIMRRHGVQA